MAEAKTTLLPRTNSEEKMMQSKFDKTPELRSLFDGVTVADFPWPGDQKVIFVYDWMSVEKAVEVLIKNNISSAPMCSTDRNSYLGVIDVNDIVALMFQIYTDAGAEHTMRALQQLVAERTAFDNATSLIDLSKTDTSLSISSDAPLLEAVDALSRGAHRLMVTSPATGQVVHILSQSTIIAFFTKHADKLGADVDRSLSQLEMGFKLVVAARAEDPLHTAYSLMLETRLSGVALEDEEGRFVGDVSCRDISGFAHERSLDVAQTSCLQFVKRARRVRHARAELVEATTVTPDATVREVLQKLKATRRHRVYIVDAKRQPVGVVSFRDIIRHFVLPRSVTAATARRIKSSRGKK